MEVGDWEKEKEKKNCSSFAVRTGMRADPVTQSGEAEWRVGAQYSKNKPTLAGKEKRPYP